MSNSTSFEDSPLSGERRTSAGLDVRIERKTFYHSDDDLEVYSDLEFKVEPQEFVCLTGPSGCGKSTLLRIIAGLDVEFDGEVCFNGDRIGAPSRERGLVFQESRLLPWKNVEENVAFAVAPEHSPAKRRKIIDSALEIVGLDHARNLLPRQLSGGMEKRAALARAISAEPKLLLLDEPFGALDFVTKFDIQESILRIQEELSLTILMVTHDVEEAVFLGDRIILLSRQRPSRVAVSLTIDLKRPRKRASPEFHRSSAAVLEAMSGVAIAQESQGI